MQQSTKFLALSHETSHKKKKKEKRKLNPRNTHEINFWTHETPTKAQQYVAHEIEHTPLIFIFSQ